MRLSRKLALIGLALLLFSYVGGPLFPYLDPITGEVYTEEENLSFQPFEFLIPEDAYSFETPPALRKHMGSTLYEYFPEGLYAYLIGYNTLPVWRVSLEAPQYPKASFPDGIPVYYHLTNFSGKVTEMNVINHFIGMDPMDIGAYHLRKFVPFIYLAFGLMLIAFMFYQGPLWWLLGLAPALMPWYFLGMYSYWLYWFGHNLHDYGAFEVKPFMPTVLGDGKVAQFTTHSYPSVGFYVLLAAFLILVLAVLVKRRVLRELKQH